MWIQRGHKRAHTHFSSRRKVKRTACTSGEHTASSPWLPSGGSRGGREWSTPLELVLKTYAECAWQGPTSPPWNVDDVTRAVPKGVGGACECPRVGVLLNFSEGGWRHAGNAQGGCLWMSSPPLQEILYPRLLTRTPFQSPGSTPDANKKQTIL